MTTINSYTAYLDNLNEGSAAADAAEAYDRHAKAARQLLDGIRAGMEKHANTSTKHWGHVGDMHHMHKKLQDLHDFLHGSGEYKFFKESKAPRK